VDLHWCHGALLGAIYLIIAMLIWYELGVFRVGDLEGAAGSGVNPMKVKLRVHEGAVDGPLLLEGVYMESDRLNILNAEGAVVTVDVSDTCVVGRKAILRALRDELSEPE